MTDAHKIYTAWTQMWNGHLDIADELLSPHFTDFLKVKDGKITDCWTMNNNAA